MKTLAKSECQGAPRGAVQARAITHWLHWREQPGFQPHVPAPPVPLLTAAGCRLLVAARLLHLGCVRACALLVSLFA
eukprot:6297321-Amphidinium_carterae.2